MEKNLWNTIISSYSQNPRDVITRPLGNRKGRWFYVNVEEGKLYVSVAQEHRFSSNLKMRRTLVAAECQKMFDLYLKRVRGVPVSEEVLKTTKNASYWFGVFSDLKLTAEI